MYDTRCNYVDAASNSFDITVEQLILNLATQLSKQIKEVPSLILVHFSIRVLASLITSFITGKRALASLNLTLVIYGMTRNKELNDIMQKCRICISYNDLLLLHKIGVSRDAETSKSCPCGTSYGKPPIVIVDSNDFQIYTLTCNATVAHRINVRYEQPQP